MRFLVIRKPTEEGLSTIFQRPGARSELREAVERAPEMIRDLKERGKLEALYAIAGEIGGVGILDVDSHEELSEILLRLPLASMADVTVVPLADWESTVQTLQQSIVATAAPS